VQLLWLQLCVALSQLVQRPPGYAQLDGEHVTVDSQHAVALQTLQTPEQVDGLDVVDKAIQLC
jgi:hypothetical protein